ncbi:MAG: catalase family peroxidase [Methyloceanibacter sp.]
MIPLFGLLILVGGTSDAKATDPTTPVELVDALNGGFGKHPHTRGSHAKGFCVSGKFTPAADAASLSKAPQFSKSVPLLGRFSTGGGNPKAADNSKGGRGLALRFDLGDGAASDFVPLSVPVFFAKTPAQVVEFLKVRTPPEGADKPDPAAIEAFSKANPETTRQAAWVKEHALPAGYAGKTHFGIHAFTLSNAAGEKKLVKLKAIPSDGEKELSDDEAKGTDFYEADFKERLAKGPAKFEFVAVLGKEGDQTSDPTLRWDGEDERPTAPLGIIEIDAIAPNETCDAITFLPANLPEGIAGSADDPILAARSGA